MEGVNASFSGETLQLTYSGSALLGKEVAFETKDGKTATLALKGNLNAGAIGGIISGSKSYMSLPEIPTAPGVIPGEVATTIENVLLTQVGEKYTFEGTDEKNGRTVKYVGEVQKEKMVLSLDVTMPEDPLQGTTWKTEGSTFVWKSSVDLELDIFNEPYKMEAAASLLNMMISPKLKEALKDVKFRADGNIVATYKEEGDKEATSPINLANYYFKDGKLYVALNIDMIIQAATKADNSELLKLITDLMQTPLRQALVEGFPLNCTIDENGVANINIDETFLKPILTVVLNNSFVMELIGSLFPNDNPVIAGIAKAALAQMPAIVEGTSELKFGLNLKK